MWDFPTQGVLDFNWDILDLLAPTSPREHGQLKGKRESCPLAKLIHEEATGRRAASSHS